MTRETRETALFTTLIRSYRESSAEAKAAQRAADRTFEQLRIHFMLRTTTLITVRLRSSRSVLILNPDGPITEIDITEPLEIRGRLMAVVARSATSPEAGMILRDADHEEIYIGGEFEIMDLELREGLTAAQISELVCPKNPRLLELRRARLEVKATVGV